MKVAYYYHTKFGNNKRIAERVSALLQAKGVEVEVSDIEQANAKNLAKADIYIFACGTRIGKPVGPMRRFVKKASKNLPDGTKYALLATHGKETPNKKTGKMPTPEEIQKYRRTLPIMTELMGPGKVKVAEAQVLIVYEDGKLSGTLDTDWEQRVNAFVAKLL